MIFQILFFISCAIAASSGDISEGAPPGFVPYHAGVYGKAEGLLDPNATVYSFLCSGALVGADAVLTTASCIDTEFYNAKGFAVVVGFVDRFDPEAVYVDVQEVRKHDAYVEGDRTNDIAVLKLSAGLTVSDNVQTIAIRESAAVAVGSTCTLSGWQKDLLTLSPVLRYSSVVVLEQATCHEAGEAEICAGAPTEADRVGCQLGDEGSPVSCDFVLTGLMHYNVDTCLSDPEPGVFGDVLHHADWIKAQLAAESMSSTSSSTSSASTSISVTPTSATSTSTETTVAYSTPTASTTSTETTVAYSTPTASTTSTSTETTATATTQSTTRAPAPTSDPDHPTGEIFAGAGTLTSSIIAIVLSAVVVVVVIQ